MTHIGPSNCPHAPDHRIFDRCCRAARDPTSGMCRGRSISIFFPATASFSLGRNHPEVRRVLIDFLNADYPSLVKMEAPLLSGLLAEELKKRMPNQLDMVFFTNSGAEGVETRHQIRQVRHRQTGHHPLPESVSTASPTARFRSTATKVFATASRRSCRTAADSVQRPRRARSGTAPGRRARRSWSSPCRARASTCRRPVICARPPRSAANTARCSSPMKCRRAWGAPGRFLAVEHDGDVDPDIVVLSQGAVRRLCAGGRGADAESDSRKGFSSMQRSVVHSSTFSQGSFAMAAGLAALDVIDRYDLIKKAEHLRQPDRRRTAAR